MKIICVALILFITISPCFAIVNTDEIIVLGDSLIIYGEENSIYRKLEATLHTRYGDFESISVIDNFWCGDNDAQSEQYYLGGASIANFLGVGTIQACNLLEESLDSSTAKWVIVMLGWNDCTIEQSKRTAMRDHFITLMETIKAQQSTPLVISEWFGGNTQPMDGYPASEDDACFTDRNDTMYWMRGEMKEYCDHESISFFTSRIIYLKNFLRLILNNPLTGTWSINRCVTIGQIFIYNRVGYTRRKMEGYMSSTSLSRGLKRFST